MKFLIGFEFEFGWLPGEAVNKIKKSKYISKLDYFDKYIYGDVGSSLKSFLQTQNKFISGITEDPSLIFEKNFRHGHFGVEIITKPMEEKIAMSVFRKILTWMQKNPNVMTNSTCGLHVNISCPDTKINKQIDYFSILQNTPQDEILEKFSRTKNSYCQSTQTRKFPLEVNNRKTKPRKLDFWLKKIKQKSICVTTSSYSNFKWDSEKQKEKIFFSNKEDAAEMIKTAFLESLVQVDKNIAIVEKKSPSKRRYFEFRMIGNADYEYRRPEIISCIGLFKKALKKSVLPIEKK